MRTFLALVIAVSMFGAAELVARRLAPGFEERIEWYDATTAIKDRQLDALRRSGAEVVLAGTSMMRDGGDPAGLLESGFPAASMYNGSLSNGSPLLMELWLRDHVVPRLEPRMVVWGLTSFDLNDASTTMAESFERYLAAPRSDVTPLGRLETLADEHSALFFHQTNLRNPESVLAAWEAVENGARPLAAPVSIPGEIAPLGNTLTRRSESLFERNISAQADVLNETALNSFTTGGRQVEALDRTTEWLHDRGIDVVYVVMPTAYQYVDSIDGERYQAPFLEALEGVARRHGVPILRPDLVIGDGEQFADLIHMNEAGVVAFTEFLVTEMDRLVEAGQVDRS